MFFLFTFYFLVIVTAQSVAFWGPIVENEKVYCRWPICRRTLDNMSQFSMRCCSTLTSIHFHRITNPSQLFRVPENLQLSIWDQLYGRRVFQIHHHQWWFTILSCFLPGFFLTSEWWSLGVKEVFHLGFTASSEAEVWWWVERGVLAHSAKFKLSKYWCLTWTTVLLLKSKPWGGDGDLALAAIGLADAFIKGWDVNIGNGAQVNSPTGGRTRYCWTSRVCIEVPSRVQKLSLVSSIFIVPIILEIFTHWTLNFPPCTSPCTPAEQTWWLWWWW